MSDRIHDETPYVVRATAVPWSDRTRVLKAEDTFAIFNRAGDIHQFGRGEQGLFHQGTRHLSLLQLTIEDALPVVLGSVVRSDNLLLAIDLTTTDLPDGNGRKIIQDTLHIAREQFVSGKDCHVRLTFTNYHDTPVRFRMGLRFDADFWDIFEVRGMERKQRGTRLDPRIEDGRIQIQYRGLDDVVRTTTIELMPAPEESTADGYRSSVEIASGERESFELTIQCDAQDDLARPDYISALQDTEQAEAAVDPRWTAVSSSNEQFDEWVLRSIADIRMLVSNTPHGPYPYAGVPWFSTPFGRDGIITALELLWLNSDIAAGVLRYLAANQAQTLDRDTDAQPGKILHETRGGEMAALGEHPFRRYYGSVDATPLFIMLAGAYYRATADRGLIDAIWPNIMASLGWIDTYGDPDGDGFVEYARVTPDGLINQGWKDSADSIFHANGDLARPPIALAEVQGYVYAAREVVAELAEVRGERELAETQRAAATRLAERFEETFWDDGLETYAVALDGDKQPCRVVSSNPGHCLLTGIVPEARAGALASRLMASDMYSGWGIRTVAAGQPRYNPMSYHNGSVWPHDTALIAAGLARYGCKEEVAELFSGMFDAALHMELHRMPELFCGFSRRPHQGPVQYPVACLPQAWSAACVIMLLGACLGLEVDAPRSELRIRNPILPDFLQLVRIDQLRVGKATISLEIHRYPDDLGVNVIQRDGPIDIVVIK